MLAIDERSLKNGPRGKKEQRSNGPADHRRAPAVSMVGHVAFWDRQSVMSREATYRTANFRGRRDSTGNRKKQITKHAAAPKLQAAKAIKRSNRLTNAEEIISKLSGGREAGHRADRRRWQCLAKKDYFVFSQHSRN